MEIEIKFEQITKVELTSFWSICKAENILDSLQEIENDFGWKQSEMLRQN